MGEAIIVGLLSLVGTVSSVVMGNRLTSYRIDQLEKKVDKHNQVVERMAVAERDVKTAFRLIDDMRDDIKNDG